MCIRDRRRLANIEKLVWLARKFDFQNKGTLLEFIRSIDAQEMEASGESDEPSFGDGSDAVRMMTFHKSKGLEFPVVVLGLLCSPLGNDPGSLLVDRKTSRFEWRKNELINTEGYSEVSEKEKLKRQAEEVRLLYVASTRAREMLIIPSFIKQKVKEGEIIPVPSSLQQIIKDTLINKETELISRFRVITLSPAEIDGSKIFSKPVVPDGREQPRTGVFTVDYESWQKKIKASIESGSVSSKPKSYTSEKGLGEDFKSGLSTASNDAEKARLEGIVFHKILELCNFSDFNSYKPITEIICKEEGLQDSGEVIAVMVQAFLRSSIAQRAVNSAGYYKEYRFNVGIENKTYVGSIDLLIKEADGFVIVDYKTDRVPEETVPVIPEAYYRQAELYEKVIKKITGEPVKEKIIYFARSGNIVSI